MALLLLSASFVQFSERSMLQLCLKNWLPHSLGWGLPLAAFGGNIATWSHPDTDSREYRPEDVGIVQKRADWREDLQKKPAADTSK